MKTIGLIGGTSFASTLLYYKYINERCYQLFNNYQTPKQIYINLNFQSVINALEKDDWDYILDILVESLDDLKHADIIVLCSNTLHMVMNEFETLLNKPFIKIMDPVGKRLANKTALLLATTYTIDKRFYAEYLKKTYNIDCLYLNPQQQGKVNDIIFNQLCHNHLSNEAIVFFTEIINDFIYKVDGIILGCTELTIPFEGIKTNISIYDSTKLHVEEVLKFSLSTNN